MTDPAAAIATQAGVAAGLEVGGRVEVLRAAENTMVRLPGGVVARVGRPGRTTAAAKEVKVSRWLSTAGVPVVRVVSGIEQPVEVDGRPVTFWQELPAHRSGGPTDVARMLRKIHALPRPHELGLPPLDPFVRMDERINESSFSPPDRVWLLAHRQKLCERYAALAPGRPWCAVHGDAWGGNIVITASGPVVLDLERFAVGPPEWDLVAIAVDHFTFASFPAEQWTAVCTSYGYDVTTWEGYEVLRDIRELRKVTFAAQMARQYPDLQPQANYRLACIRGDGGPRPWRWTEVP